MTFSKLESIREWLSPKEAFSILSKELNESISEESIDHLINEAILKTYLKTPAGQFNILQEDKRETGIRKPAGYYQIATSRSPLVPANENGLMTLRFLSKSESGVLQRLKLLDESGNLMIPVSKMSIKEFEKKKADDPFLIDPFYYSFRLYELGEGNIYIKKEDIQSLISTINKSSLKETISSKSKNSYLKVINALSEALINGRSGAPYKDAEVIEQALASKQIKLPIKTKTLGDYLSEYDKNLG